MIRIVIITVITMLITILIIMLIVIVSIPIMLIIRIVIVIMLINNAMASFSDAATPKHSQQLGKSRFLSFHPYKYTEVNVGNQEENM